MAGLSRYALDRASLLRGGLDAGIVFIYTSMYVKESRMLKGRLVTGQEIVLRICVIRFAPQSHGKRWIRLRHTPSARLIALLVENCGGLSVIHRR